ncbi:hypothetical protein [Yersinia sp. Marseille-Q3913]|uniref:hypothetical protein n=1 Tax=Yersinia sp. Marseille-Q3913 TaxID=2830769 RepID=UPI001BAF8B82|nr:hypothetical protein [Yersinia sp. Marseille-Q3913]MBS0056948.1 hypothetical protein [Yersinia sp. Marseille-Q3913]
MKNYSDFLIDPDNKGWVLGYGVFRNSPWHFVETFNTEQEALEKRAEYDSDYKVAYGSHRVGSDDFVHDGNTQ